MVFVAKRIARRDVLDPDDRGDVAGITGLDVFPLVSLNLDQAADALALVCPWIVNRVALGKRTRINPEKDQFPDEWIAPKFESKGTEFSVVIRRRLDSFMGIGFHANRRRDIERAGQIVDDRIDQVLNALILESRTAHDRDKLVRDRLPADSSLQYFSRDRFLFEEKRADLVIDIRNRRDQIVVRLVNARLVLIWYCLNFVD